MRIDQRFNLEKMEYIKIIQLEKQLEKAKEAYKQSLLGSELSFGSNVHGECNDDGSVWYNSHNEEEFYFDTVDDFIKYYFYDDKSVPCGYKYICGRWDDDFQNPILNEGITGNEADLNDDGSDIWSKMEGKNGYIVISTEDSSLGEIVTAIVNVSESTFQSFLTQHISITKEDDKLHIALNDFFIDDDYDGLNESLKEIIKSSIKKGAEILYISINK